jgi:hypothetical protein
MRLTTSQLKENPIRYISVMAAALLLLAWSIDNIIKQKIDVAVLALEKAEQAEIQIEFQTSILHDLSSMRDKLSKFSQVQFLIWQKEKMLEVTDEGIIRGGYIDSQMKNLNDYLERMKTFDISARLYGKAFRDVKLPPEIHDRLYGAIDKFREFYQFLISIKMKMVKTVNRAVNNKLEGIPKSIDDIPKDVSIVPTEEDVRLFDQQFTMYWMEILKKNKSLCDIIHNLHYGYQDALNYTRIREERLNSINHMISWTYVFVFIIGSAFSIIATFLKPSKTGKADEL